MNAFANPELDQIFYRISWTIVHSIWQFTAIAAVLVLALAIVRQRSPSLKYIALTLALALIIMTFMTTFAVITVPLELGGAESSTGVHTWLSSSKSIAQPAIGSATNSAITHSVESELSPQTSPSTTTSTPPPFHTLAQFLTDQSRWITMAWTTGVLVFSAWHIGGWLSIIRLRHSHVTPANSKLADQFESLRKRVLVSRYARIFESALVEVPIVIGWLRPVILFPASMATGLSSSELAVVLAHELAHIRRRDYLINILQSASESILFYHPAVWWISNQMRIAREHCCDDVAVQHGGSALEVARTLASVEETRLSGLAMAITGRGRESGTAVRIKRLLGIPTREVHGLSALCSGLLLSTLCIAAVSGLGFNNTDNRSEKNQEFRTLIIKDGESGKPVSNFTIEAAPFDRDAVDLNWTPYKSNANGSVQVPLDAKARMLLRVRSRNQWCDQAMLNGGEAQGPIPVTIWNGTALKGRVLQSNGDPASGMVLHVGTYIESSLWKERLGMSTAFQTWDRSEWPNWTRRVTTKADGTFSIITPPSSSLLWARVGTPSIRVGMWTGDPKPEYPSFETEQVLGAFERTDRVVDFKTIVIEKGTHLGGIVRDADNRPLANVDMYLHTGARKTAFGTFSDFSSTRSGDDGSFEFRSMLSGPASLSAHAWKHDDEGNAITHDVHAVFLNQSFTISDLVDKHDISVHAVAHVRLEFQRVDRRKDGAPVKFRFSGLVKGKVRDRRGELVEFQASLLKSTRDGKPIFVCNVPRDLIKAELHLPAGAGVRFSYVDGDLISKPLVVVYLKDVNSPTQGIIYVDDRVAR